MSEPTNAVHHAGNAVTGAFTRKIGPLPGWAWVGIILAGAYGYYWYSHRNSTSTPGTATPRADFASGNGSGGRGSGSGGKLIKGKSSGQTNKDWEVLAINAVRAAGGHDELHITTAISTYINHPERGLTKNQAAIVSQAISLIGPPPNPHPIKQIPNPKPPDKHPTKHPGHTVPHQTYHINPGDTLGLIALRFYGDRTKWQAIKQRNPQKLAGKDENTALLGMVGDTITIPAGHKDT